ncbi:hypothetical protein NQZ79_g8077 [Umbelopsis isabellina]|nr:hypothetical protein NQZ79_g8077 [Umbelopsis isabellina]
MADIMNDDMEYLPEHALDATSVAVDLTNVPLRRRMTSPSRRTLRHRVSSSLSELETKDLTSLLHGRSLTPKPLDHEANDRTEKTRELFSRPYTPYSNPIKRSDLYCGSEFDFVELRNSSHSAPPDETARNPFSLNESLLDSDTFVDNAVNISWRDLVQNRHRLDMSKTKRPRHLSSPTSMDIDPNQETVEQESDKDRQTKRNALEQSRKIFTKKTARPNTTANIFVQDAKKEDDAEYTVAYY